MKVLRIGSTGDVVRCWQLFLIGQGFRPGPPDGKFGPQTNAATQAFQSKHRLVADGIVGNRTCGIAMTLGMAILDTQGWDEESGPNWPSPPNFSPLTSISVRQRLFGRFAYVHEPLPDNAENIRITDTWEKDNIVRVVIPQLVGVRGAPRNGTVRFHRLAAPRVAELFEQWGQVGLLDRILTWEGSFVPRFVRGKTELSNHAFGTAFDINYNWNRLGTTPALKGQDGSVRELVSIANKLGFYWGGHFKRRPDGMHFELATTD